MRTPFFFLFLLFVSVEFVAAQKTDLRRITPLDGDWKFVFEEVSDGASLSCDDTGWETVIIPHDWAIGKPFNLDIDLQNVMVMADGEQKASLRTGRTGALPSIGIGWYRKKFHIPASDRDKKTIIEFDGAMSLAKIYLNGRFIGEWPYGYTSFSFDVTDYLVYGEENLLAVRLQNEEEASRWYTGGGLYRNVRLITTDKVHVAHWGTYITTPEISKRKSKVVIRTRVNAPTGVEQKIILHTLLLDADDREIACGIVKRNGSGIQSFEQTLTVPEPQLWSPDMPYLYKAVSRIQVNGEWKDRYETVFGIRSVVFDNNKGFILNGKQTKLKGVCLHHDLGPIGAAVNVRAMQRQLEMLKDMGCNAIRTSHNPPDPGFLHLCDSMGFMVIDEAFDEWKLPKMKNGYHKFFDKWAERDLVAMIHRDRNHPSVILWSIGNEIEEQQTKDGGKVAAYLTEICHREDPTRLTTAGLNKIDAALETGFVNNIDVVGINYINALWRSSLTHYKEMHEKYPHLKLLGSETQSTTGSIGVYKLPVRKIFYPWHTDYQVSSYDMEGPSWFSTPDEEFFMQEECEAVAGEFVWTGFDYLGEPCPYNGGSPARSSFFGIIDFTGIPKDRFYLFKSHWSREKVLHLLPHWNWHAGDTIPVMCYTNYAKAELFLNGKSLGMRTFDKQATLTSEQREYETSLYKMKKKQVVVEKQSIIFNRYRLIWDAVPYEPGELKVVAYDENDKIAEERIVHTAGAPARISLSADRSVVNADGKDLCYVTVSITDKNDVPCPLADNLLFFEVTGNGRLRAAANGDATDLTAFSSNYYRVFNGKLVLVIEPSKHPGDILVRVNGGMLSSGEVVIKCE